MGSCFGGLRSRLRTVVERIPALAISYRTIREEIAWQRQKPAITPFGFQLLGDPAMQSGEFEPEETQLFRDLVENADVFVDIGANIGYYSCIARSMGKKVVSFEPMAANLRTLYQNLAVNNWDDIEVWPLGLSDAPGVVTIYGQGTGASLVPGWAGSSAAFSHTISVSTLDTLLGPRFEDENMFVKIDVEGAELGVLKGAQNVLRRTPKAVWLIEITLTENRTCCNPKFVETFEQFWANNYEAFTADAQRRKVTKSDVARWAAEGKVDFGTYNYLFMPA